MKKSAVNEDIWPFSYDNGPYLDYKRAFVHPFFSFDFNTNIYTKEIKFTIRRDVFRNELELWFEAGGFYTVHIGEVKTEIDVYSHQWGDPQAAVEWYYFSLKFETCGGHFDYMTLLDTNFKPQGQCVWELAEESDFIFSHKDAEGEVRSKMIGGLSSFSKDALGSSFTYQGVHR
jgi:hypothetical protein